jgi:hypothetical protein
MSPTSQANEGWGTWATRAFNERTEKLNAVTDNMNNLSANSAGWADDVSKFVGKQKRGFVMGAVKSKFGFWGVVSVAWLAIALTAWLWDIKNSVRMVNDDWTFDLVEEQAICPICAREDAPRV